MFGEIETGNLSRSEAIQRRVGPDEVKEEDKHGYEVVGSSERRKTLFGFVPRLELLIEALNEVV